MTAILLILVVAMIGVGLSDDLVEWICLKVREYQERRRFKGKRP